MLVCTATFRRATQSQALHLSLRLYDFLRDLLLAHLRPATTEQAFSEFGSHCRTPPGRRPPSFPSLTCMHGATPPLGLAGFATLSGWCSVGVDCEKETEKRRPLFCWICCQVSCRLSS